LLNAINIRLIEKRKKASNYRMLGIPATGCIEIYYNRLYILLDNRLYCVIACPQDRSPISGRTAPKGDSNQ
jgi:hypothetical protein